MGVHVFSFCSYDQPYDQTEHHADLTSHALTRSDSTGGALYADSVVALGILRPFEFSRTSSANRLACIVSCIGNGKVCVVMVVKTRGFLNFSHLLLLRIMKMVIKLVVV
jgi:hypothetical protein